MTKFNKANLSRIYSLETLEVLFKVKRSKPKQFTHRVIKRRGEA